MSGTNLMKAETLSSDSKSLEFHGIIGVRNVFWNLSAEQLLEHSLKAGDGVCTNSGALVCYTGQHTGRSPNDKFVVEDAQTKKHVFWGPVNQPLSEENFSRLEQDQRDHLKGKDVYVLDAFGGADPKYRLPIRVINERAWANLFCKQLFIRPKPSELDTHTPGFTIIHTPSFQATPSRHGTRSETFIVVNFSKKVVLIGGTAYAGEMKKSIFTILNYIYPLQGILSMHCSANVNKTDASDVALFFGLSGTGKTTLSADNNRALIGDDEHGWTNSGVFNFEGGCYAKCINLSEEREPQIYRAIREGAVLENVVLDEKTNAPKYDDASRTENTRAAYPIEFIDGAVLSGVGAHPKNIIFLTCDAFGVMPPIAKLTPDQAMYHFLSGYTAKVAGTERGAGDTPKATFSTCFGAPFLPLNPTTYADLLGKKLKEHKVECWLVNTGWIGGGVGVGERIKLSYTRRMINAIFRGELASVTYQPDPIFGFAIPSSVPEVPTELLTPKNSWKNPAQYDEKAKNLAGQFTENFKRFEQHAPQLKNAGPR